MSQKQPEGYLARPSEDGTRPVLVLHAWWGLNDTVKRFCDRLADSGFVAFAPDLYHGKIATTIAEAEQLGSALDARSDQAKDEIAQAVSFLCEHAGSHSLAVIGFSLGASYAIDLASADPDRVHSVVLYYGVGAADFDNSKAAYLGHFAENDQYEPLENVEWLENQLRKAGRPLTFHVYQNTGHWFAEPDRKGAYSHEEAELAWERTITFLRRDTDN